MAEQRARRIAGFVIGLCALAACGDDDAASAPGATTHGDGGARDAGGPDASLPAGNVADAGAPDAAASATGGGSGFDFDDFAIDEDAGSRGGDGPVSNAWSCEPALRGDGACDCGCGDGDPDCSDRSCRAAGCFAPGCDVCHGKAGKIMACQAHWMCTLEREGGGDGCNCGCGTLDTDCALETGCGEPGCTASGCITCRSADGTPMSCAP